MLRDFLAYWLGLLLEVGILSFIIYYVLYFLRGTRSVNILTGVILVITILTIATEKLHFTVLTTLLNGLWSVSPIALFIIFQPELRRAFAQIGTKPFARRKRKEETISEVIVAVSNLASKRIGALIVFQRQIGIRALISNGETLDAEVNHMLIESIFHPGNPLHDGGMAIDNNDRISAAHIIFPLTQSAPQNPSLGTRHRAALGITEETDTVAVVVSEETGKISIACRGDIRVGLSPDRLVRYLHALLMKADTEADLSDFDSETGESDGSAVRQN